MYSAFSQTLIIVSLGAASWLPCSHILKNHFSGLINAALAGFWSTGILLFYLLLKILFLLQHTITLYLRNSPLFISLKIISSYVAVIYLLSAIYKFICWTLFGLEVEKNWNTSGKRPPSSQHKSHCSLRNCESHWNNAQEVLKGFHMNGTL